MIPLCIMYCVLVKFTKCNGCLFKLVFMTANVLLFPFHSILCLKVEIIAGLYYTLLYTSVTNFFS